PIGRHPASSRAPAGFPHEGRGFGEFPHNILLAGLLPNCFPIRFLGSGVPIKSSKIRNLYFQPPHVEDLGFCHPRTWRSWTDMLSAGCACGGVGLAMVFRSSIRATESRVKST